MFSADLTWDAGPTERIGQRRERKVKEKAGSVKSVDQARPSSNRRWLSTKKTSLDVSVTSIGLSCTAIARPDTATTALPPQTPLPKYSFDGHVPSRTLSRKGSKRVVPPPDPKNIKDPEDQPDDWILAGRLSPDSTKPAYHRQTHSSKSFEGMFDVALTSTGFEFEKPTTSWSQKFQPAYDNAEARHAETALQKFDFETTAQHTRQLSASPERGIALTTGVSLRMMFDSGVRLTHVQFSVTSEDRNEDVLHELPAFSTSPRPSPPTRNPSRLLRHKRTQSGRGVKSNFYVDPKPPTPSQSPAHEDVKISHRLPSLCLPLATLEINTNEWVLPPATPPSTAGGDPRSFSRLLPNDWEFVASPDDSGTDENTTFLGDSPGYSPSTQLSHFQRFVRRMENAGPKIVLERLKEEWNEPFDKAMRDELELEKHLWALTALQLHNLDKFAKTGQDVVMLPLPDATPKRRRRILELGGNLGKSFGPLLYHC